MTVKRKRNFVELQPYMVAYGGIISMVSPLASIYQLSRLNPHIPCSTSQMVKLAAIVFPVQTILKTIQMNISTPVKSNLNVWAAFAVVGVLQGGVYGQCNIYFSKKLGIGKTLSLKGMFRGVGFAGFRDMISQGVPFIFSEYTRKYIFNSILPESKVLPDDTSFNLTEFVRKWGPVLSTSMFATVASQGISHLYQININFLIFIS